MILRKYLIILTSAVFVGAFTFGAFEPSEVQSQTATTTVSVALTVTSEINISCSTSSVALSPSIPGQTGGLATGSFSCAVETNDTSGYSMKIKEDHKLQTDASGDPDTYFADYTEATPLDYTWQTPSSGDEKFGFNITAGTDTVAKYKDDGTSTCGTGTAPSPDHCWNGFKTIDEEVAKSTAPTPAGGTSTSFDLKAEAAGSNNLREGTYSNTLTVTAVTNP